MVCFVCCWIIPEQIFYAPYPTDSDVEKLFRKKLKVKDRDWHLISKVE